MAPPYRDRIAKVAWTEKVYGGTVLLDFNHLGTQWYCDPAWSVNDTLPGPYPTGTFFPITGPCIATPTVIYLNGFRFGSHTPIAEYVSGSFSAIGTPGARVKVRGSFNWSYYSYAVAPYIKIRVYANGQVFNNLPATFTWDDGFPTDFEIDTTLDGSGGLGIEMKIEEDTGIGSASLIASLTLDQVVELPCDGQDVSFELLTPYPLEEVRAYSAPRAGSVRHVFPSGERDAWLTGFDGRLESELRWIPANSQLALPDNDAWEDRDDSGTTRAGWGRFFRHALRGRAFTFYPDAADVNVSHACQWAGEEFAIPTLEQDMERTHPFVIRTTDGSDFDGYSQ